MTCAEKREIFFRRAGCLQFGRGEMGWGKRRRNRGGEGRHSGDILNFTDIIECISCIYHNRKLI